MTTAAHQPQLTQDGREHYQWQRHTSHPCFPGRVFIAEHPTVYEYAIMRCPAHTRTVLVELHNAYGSVKATFPDALDAQGAIEARWLTYPGYGHSKGE